VRFRILQKVKLDKKLFFPNYPKNLCPAEISTNVFFHLESQFQKLDIIFYGEDQVRTYFGGSNLMSSFFAG